MTENVAHEEHQEKERFAGSWEGRFWYSLEYEAVMEQRKDVTYS